MTKLLIVTFLLLSGCRTAVNNDSVNEEVNRYFVKAKEYINQNADTVRHCIEAIQRIADTSNAAQKCKLYYVQGAFELSKGKSSSAEYSMEAAKKAAKSARNDTLEGYALMGIGSSNLYSGNIAKSLDAYLSAKGLFERSGINELIEKAYSSLALAYYYNFDFTNAEKYVQLINSISAKHSRAYLIGLHVESNIFSEHNLLDSALQRDRLGVKTATQNNINGMSSAFYDNMATCYMQKNESDSAKYFYYKCLAIDSSGGQPLKMADTYAKLVNLTGRLKDETRLKDVANKAMKFCDSMAFTRGKYNIYLGLIDFYTQKGDANKLLVLKDSLINIKDKMINLESQNKIDELNVKYQTLEQDAIIIKQKNTLQKNQLLLIALLAVTTLLILLFYGFYKNARSNKALAIGKAIQEQKDRNVETVFQSEQNERVRIARDLHDSVGQKLSVLKMYLGADDIKKEKLENLLDDTINEVRSISHNLIPEALNFGLMTAVTSTIRKMQSDFPIQINYTIHDNCRNITIELLRSLNIFRVFQEIISNAVKHSGAKTIDIDIKQLLPNLVITIADNGRGLNEADLQKSNGIGWKNIHSRIALLKADLQITPLTPSGTMIRIQIPLA